MRPAVAEKSRNAPENAEGFDSPGCLGLAHIGRFPAKLGEYFAHRGLCVLVVAANEHGWLAFPELRIDHAGVADRN